MVTDFTGITLSMSEVKYQFQKFKLKLGQNEANQSSKFVEAGGGGDTLLCWRIVGYTLLASLAPSEVM